MFSRNRMKGFTASCSGQIEQLKQALETADAVLIGETLMRAADKKAKLARPLA